jgi:hypothetical protein
VYVLTEETQTGWKARLGACHAGQDVEVAPEVVGGAGESGGTEIILIDGIVGAVEESRARHSWTCGPEVWREFLAQMIPASYG